MLALQHTSRHAALLYLPLAIFVATFLDTSLLPAYGHCCIVHANLLALNALLAMGMLQLV